jgi:hypothetical protein
MTRLPAFEFARLVFLAGVAQFRDDFGILRGEPILKFVKRFHRRKHFHRNFNGLRCHEINLTAISGMASGKLDFRSCRRRRADAFANSQTDITQCAGGV